MTYAAPIRQIRFALRSIVGIDRLHGHPAFPDFNDEIAAAVLDEAGRFANEVIAPLNQVGDREGATVQNGRVRLATGFAEAYRGFVAAGWGGVTGPVDHGGQGLPHVLGLAVQELWHGACMSFGLCPLLSQGAIEALTAHGSDQQRATYLPKLVSGEWTGTMNLTEPQAGSDVGALTTRAVPAGDGSYRIQGTKIYITWGEHEAADNIVHLVLARLPDAPPGTRGISLFLVPKFLVNADGSLGARNDLRCVGLENKLGIHGSPTCVMAYGDGGGATGYLIGAENKGMSAMFTMMNSARLGIGMQGVGIAERSYQQALAFARERRQGKPFGLQHEIREMSRIITHADVRRMLLTQKSMIEAGRAICLANALAIDMARHAETAEARNAAKAREELLTPISKAWCTDMAVTVTSIGIQVHGGMGFIEETGAAQHFRDARIAPIYEGTNGIQSIDLIGRKLSLEGGAAVHHFMDEILETARLCAGGPSALRAIGKEIEAVHRACHDATIWLQTTIRSSPASALPGSAPYLQMMGLLSGAHFLARGALAAALQADDRDADTRFLNARISVAQFFAEQVLPMAVGLLGPVTRGADGPFAMSAEDLEL